MTHVNPLFFWAPAALLVPILLAAAYLFFSLKVELKLLSRRALTRAEFDKRWAEVVTELETLRAQLASAESRPAPQEWSEPDRPTASMNLNRRGQILRLHGKGRSTAEIASDLQVSQGEVELLLKVHDWSATIPL
jgi:DNA-binding NarL/FixJ family response regulator